MRSVLVTAVAVVALSVLAPAALGQEPVTEVSDDSAHCPDNLVVGSHSVSGGCVFHVVSEPGTSIDVIGHIPFFGEFLDAQCTNEYDLHIGETGNLAATNISFGPAGGVQCSLAPCQEAGQGQDPWTAQGVVEDHTVGHIEFELEICVISANLGEVAPDVDLELSWWPPRIRIERIEELSAFEMNGAWTIEGSGPTTVH